MELFCCCKSGGDSSDERTALAGPGGRTRLPDENMVRTEQPKGSRSGTQNEGVTSRGQPPQEIDFQTVEEIVDSQGNKARIERSEIHSQTSVGRHRTEKHQSQYKYSTETGRAMEKEMFPDRD